MGRKLYVGNLPFSANQKTLQNKFSECGKVDSVNIIMGQSKGIAYIDMSSDSEAQNAIKKFNGSNLDGRKIKVNEARQKAPQYNRDGDKRWH